MGDSIPGLGITKADDQLWTAPLRPKNLLTLHPRHPRLTLQSCHPRLTLQPRHPQLTLQPVTRGSPAARHPQPPRSPVTHSSPCTPITRGSPCSPSPTAHLQPRHLWLTLHPVTHSHPGATCRVSGDPGVRSVPTAVTRGQREYSCPSLLLLLRPHQGRNNKTFPINLLFLLVSFPHLLPLVPVIFVFQLLFSFWGGAQSLWPLPTRSVASPQVPCAGFPVAYPGGGTSSPGCRPAGRRGTPPAALTATSQADPPALRARCPQ